MADPSSQELYSERVQAGSRTYFFDVKMTSDGTKYLVLSESRRVHEAWRHHRVMVFMENIEAFHAAFVRAVEVLGGVQKAYSLEEIRKLHARAYEPWTAEEEQRLCDLYQQGTDISELAIEFQRRASAIRSRLAKLGFDKHAFLPEAPTQPVAEDAEQAKLLVLKAYLLIQQASPEKYDELKAKAESALHFLENADAVEDLRRRVFYRLLIAELTRETDPIPARAAALEDGVRLAVLGYTDPMVYYMRMVGATTGTYRPTDTGALVRSYPGQGSLTRVLTALQLEESVFIRHDHFLQSVSLDEIRARHGIP